MDNDAESSIRRSVMWWLFLLVPLAVVILFPYIRMGLFRLSFSFRLCRFCKKQNYRLIPTHFFWMFGKTGDCRCDFYIEMQDKILSVKLCGCLFRRSNFHYIDRTHYAVQSLRFSLACTRFSIPYQMQSKPEYDFGYGFPKDGAKNICPILLMLPVFSTVTKEADGEKLPVGNGDDIGEAIFYTKNGFWNFLDRRTETGAIEKIA